MRPRFESGLTAFLLAAVLVPGNAAAAVYGGDQLAGIDVGAVMPNIQVTGDRPGGGTGVLAGAQYLYQLTPHIGVGADAQEGDLLGASFPAVEAGAPARLTASGLVRTFEVEARYVFFPYDRFNPYLIAGVGANYITLEQTRGRETFLNSSDTTAAVSAGLGVETLLKWNFVGGLEARWRYLGDGGWTQASGGEVTSIGSGEFTVAARIGYRFSGQ